MRPMGRVVAVLLAVVLAVAVTASARADTIDDYVRAEMARRSIPGLAIAVARHGALVDERSYGLAHVETNAPVTPHSIFAIASLDKQLTAAGVLKAAEQGRLALDDPLEKWVETPFAGVRLRHLLSHTAGLPDQVAGEIEGRAFTDYTTEQLLATVRGLVPLGPPGARFSYSDAGSFLAQLATEKAVGEPWWSFMQREVFAPAGMRTAVSMAPASLLPQRVSAYTLDGDGALRRDRRLDVDYGPLYSDLGMTAADFGRWLAALETTRPLSAASAAAIATPIRLADGGAASEVFQWSRYGLGVGIDEVAGEPVTLHSGSSGVGFVRFTRLGLAVVVFTNLEHPAGSDPVGLALAIAGLLDPRLSLAALPSAAPGDAGRSAQLAAEAERLLAGKPNLDLYAPRLRAAVWEGVASLNRRLPRFGGLLRAEWLPETTVDTERAFTRRVLYERATLYLRFSLDAGGAISRLVWWHL